jgi:hypothetical protein
VAVRFGGSWRRANDLDARPVREMPPMLTRSARRFTLAAYRGLARRCALAARRESMGGL